jgi:hypothetical protein
LSRNSREPLPSQILTPACDRGREDVSPAMNQRSSRIMARVKTRFVVRRGRIGVPEGEWRVNFRGRGAKRE